MSGEHAHPNYVKIWGILLVHLVASVVRPMFEIPALTIVTAFGIALVKAFTVAANFLHLKYEKKYIWYLLVISICFLGVLFFGAGTDIISTEGQQWKDCIADKTCIDQRM